MQMKEDRKAENCHSCRAVGDVLVPGLFRALGDPTRVAILAHLAELCGPASVGSIACCTPVDVSVVSRHLATLREAGIVDARRKGREVLYSVRYPELVKTLRAVADALEACCPAGPPREDDEIAPEG
ncbi:MAG: metalloregulator ArsR/SmtB family transcription factor [Candidatus Eisenbacteria bacterium]